MAKKKSEAEIRKRLERAHRDRFVVPREDLATMVDWLDNIQLFHAKEYRADGLRDLRALIKKYNRKLLAYVREI